jgi:hypothetical protein
LVLKEILLPMEAFTMRRVLALVPLLATFSVLSAQTAPNFDAILNLVTNKHGGAALNVANSRLAGTLSTPGAAAVPFTLTLQDRSLRIEVQKPTGLFAEIRQDRRGQAVSGDKRAFPDQLPLYSSAINMAPAFGLVHYKTDVRFARVVATAPDGSLGLRFVEGVPAGAKPSPFVQPKAIVTFWLDSTYQIQSVSYADSGNPSFVATYKYYYAGALTAPFLQPKKVDFSVGQQTLWSADVSAATVNVALAADFFAIFIKNPIQQKP